MLIVMAVGFAWNELHAKSLRNRIASSEIALVRCLACCFDVVKELVDLPEFVLWSALCLEQNLKSSPSNHGQPNVCLRQPSSLL
jgi:hypothetical protein